MEAERTARQADRLLPLLQLLLVLSGAAALVYEVVWFHLLRQVVGASAPSLAIVLGSFMGGLCIGSLGFARVVPPGRHPLRVYAQLEAGIAALGLAMLILLPLLGRLYFAVVGFGMGGLLLRALVCALCLLPPTILMGATLPAISRLLETSRIGVSRMGLLYAANTLGGVVGCLAAGFHLLRLYDLFVATYVAVGTNLVAMSAALLLARSTPYEPARSPTPDAASPRAARWPVHLVAALSGSTALGAQAVWTRQLSMVFGATVFSFSIILAIFLVGIASGSGLGSALARHARSPWRWLAGCQLALAGAIPFAAHVIGLELPYWHLNPELESDLVQRYGHDLLRAAVAVLPATLLWGASFPLALAAAAGGQEPGRLIGRLYAANTIGSILGAVLFALVVIPALGSTAAQRILTCLAGAAAALLVASASLGAGSQPAPFARATRWPAPARAVAPLALVAAAVAATTLLVPPLQPDVIAHGRHAGDREVQAYPYVAEGVHSAVAVAQQPQGRSLHVGGKIIASSYPEDLRLQRMLGHLPALFHGAPKSVLVVGMGTGATAGSFVAYPEVERIVVCEIEPLVVHAAGQFFAGENLGLLDDPRVEVVIDDARHFLASTSETFDVISSDPIHPWMDGAAALFSTEYYRLAKARLEPGGIVAQWLPAYETDLDTVRSALATFFDVFPEGTVWNSHIPMHEGNDFVMIARDGGMRIDAEQVEARIGSNPRVRSSLEEVDLGFIVTLLAAYSGRGPDLRGWLEGAEIHRDRSLRLQYLAGRAIDEDQGMEIYRAVASHRRYPRDLIAAPGWLVRRLAQLWN